MQIKTIFEYFQYVCDKFEFLKPESIIKAEETKFIKSSYDFVQDYKSDVMKKKKIAIYS